MHTISLDATTQLLGSIKEEVTSRAGSEHGEEEMEVDSTEEHEEEAKSQAGQAQAQVSKNNNMGSSFNTPSSLGSLRPGNAHTHTHTHTHCHTPVNVSTTCTF